MAVQIRVNTGMILVSGFAGFPHKITGACIFPRKAVPFELNFQCGHILVAKHMLHVDTVSENQVFSVSKMWSALCGY